MKTNLIKNLISSIELKNLILKDKVLLNQFNKISQVCIAALKNKKKVLFCGNGGSAADAQHLAAELSGRFYFDRPPLYSEALHVNSSYLTAVANDYGYEKVFSRMISASCVKGDILIGLSTSGNSPNIIHAIKQANNMGVITIGFTGSCDSKINGLVNYLIQTPSTDTARIQELHMIIGHSLCETIEKTLFPKKYN